MQDHKLASFRITCLNMAITATASIMPGSQNIIDAAKNFEDYVLGTLRELPTSFQSVSVQISDEGSEPVCA